MFGDTNDISIFSLCFVFLQGILCFFQCLTLHIIYKSPRRKYFYCIPDEKCFLDTGGIRIHTVFFSLISLDHHIFCPIILTDRICRTTHIMDTICLFRYGTKCNFCVCPLYALISKHRSSKPTYRLIGITYLKFIHKISSYNNVLRFG